MKPVRIVLSRRSGFNLQAISQSINGLPALSVARPGVWGNLFRIGDVADELGLGKDAAQVEAVARYSGWIRGDSVGPYSAPSRDSIRAMLGGKNLACWCRKGSPCHVDILLDLAND